MLMDKVFNYLCVLTNPITVNEILSILSALFVILNFEPNRIPSILDLVRLVSIVFIHPTLPAQTFTLND